MTYLPSTSALARSIHGDQALWSTQDHLLALAVDALHAANWQRGGGKGKRPRPVPRPGEQDKGRKRFGTGRMSLDVARTFFERVNRRPADPVCSGDGCIRDIHARGMCSKHYQRWRRSSRA